MDSLDLAILEKMLSNGRIAFKELAWGQIRRGREKAKSRPGWNALGTTNLSQREEPRRLIFARQFKSALVVILLTTALISLALGETVDAAVISGIISAVSLLSFLQEYRAERALGALERMAAPSLTV